MTIVEEDARVTRDHTTAESADQRLRKGNRIAPAVGGGETGGADGREQRSGKGGCFLAVDLLALLGGIGFRDQALDRDVRVFLAGVVAIIVGQRKLC